MPPTRINTFQVLDESITRDDLNATTSGKAVAKKILQGANVTLTSTGVDSGTGDVTVSVNSFPWGSVSGKPTTLAGYGITDVYTKTDINSGLGIGGSYFTSNLGNLNTHFIMSGTPKPVFGDDDFAVGENGISVYDNVAQGAITVTRKADPLAPNQSKYVLEIVRGASGSTSPGLGGFVQSYVMKPNEILLQRFVAKIPVGYTLASASNQTGDGPTDYWATPNVGTGKWETYVRVRFAGQVGTFSVTGHIYLTGPPGAVTWHIASSNIYLPQVSGTTRISDYQIKDVAWSKITGIPDLVPRISTTNLTSRVSSGFYEQPFSTKATGWPEDTSSWYHSIVATHSNPDNYYSIQLASPFHSQKLFFRVTNNDGSRPWQEVYHTGNLLPARTNQSNTFTAFNQFDGGAGFFGRIHVGTANTGGNMIDIADDGNLADLQDSYLSLRFNGGVKVHSGPTANNPVHQFHSNGHASHSGALTVGGEVAINPQDNNFEGGQVVLRAAANAPRHITVDNYNGIYRVFSNEDTNMFLEMDNTNLSFGNLDHTVDHAITVKSGSANKAGFEAYGADQGTGYLFVGQSSAYGGGVYYNGDGTPAFASSGEVSDQIVFYRREAGSNIPVFHYPFNNSNVYFNGNTSSLIATGRQGLYTDSGYSAYTSYLRNTAGHIAVQMTDSWLRLNEQLHFSSGIFTGTGVLRTDGNFQIGPGGSRANFTSGLATLSTPLHLLNGHDLILKADDTGDIIFQNAAGVEQGRIWSTGGTSLNFSAAVGGPSTNFSITPKGALVNGQFVTKYGDLLQPLNSFTDRKFYNTQLNNALYHANRRWEVTAKVYNADGSFSHDMDTSQFFNMNYEDIPTVPAGKKLIVNIKFGGQYPGYPYGRFILSYYNVGFPAWAKLRAYCDFATHGIGWKEIDFVDYDRRSNTLVQTATQWAYGITEVEIIVQARPDAEAYPCEIEWELDRPTGQEFPYVSKMNHNDLFTNLRFRDGSNNESIFLNASTGEALFRSIKVGGLDVLTSTFLVNRIIGNASVNNDSGLGAYYISSGANGKPPGTDHALLRLAHSAPWSFDMAGDWRTDNLYIRGYANGTPRAWQTVWHSGNFTPGSYYTKSESDANLNNKNYLFFSDTRSVNYTPAEYDSHFRTEFKFRNVIGAPGTATYGGLLTIAPWSDGSGGFGTQIFSSADGIFTRNADLSASSWNGWGEIVVSNRYLDAGAAEKQIGFKFPGANTYYYANTNNTREVGLYDTDVGIIWRWIKSTNELNINRTVRSHAGIASSGSYAIWSTSGWGVGVGFEGSHGMYFSTKGSSHSAYLGKTADNRVRVMGMVGDIGNSSPALSAFSIDVSNGQTWTYGNANVGGSMFIAANHTGSVEATPAINFAIGDPDTGLNWHGDGHVGMWANSTHVGGWTSAGIYASPGKYFESPIYGLLNAPGGVTINGMAGGGVDAAGFGRNNVEIMSWYGIGFRSTNDNTTRIYMITRDGLIATTGQINAQAGFYQSSSRVLKTDIRDPEFSGLDIIMSTAVKTFKYISDEASEERVGFIAEDTPKELSGPGQDKFRTTDTVAVLMKALQELTQKVEILEGELRARK